MGGWPLPLIRAGCDWRATRLAQASEKGSAQEVLLEVLFARWAAAVAAKAPTTALDLQIGILVEGAEAYRASAARSKRKKAQNGNGFRKEANP